MCLRQMSKLQPQLQTNQQRLRLVEKHKLAIGVAVGGKQGPDWWGMLTAMAANFHLINVDFHGLLYAGSMMVDGNRNNIVTGFLKSEADWLLWIDTDVKFKLGAVKRLLDARRTLISGVYVGKTPPYTNIAFRRQGNGRYVEVSEFEDYYRGEIIEIDMAGMGFCLTHRTVFEDMQKKFTVYQDQWGHYWPIFNEDVMGAVKERDTPGSTHIHDGKVYKGQLRIRLWPLDHEITFWPWFQMRYGKTEDVVFFEHAQKAGHNAWLDTSLSAEHIGPYEYTQEDRKRMEEKTNVVRHPRDYEVTYVEKKPQDHAE